MFKFKYNRLIHILALIVLLMISIITIVVFFISPEDGILWIPNGRNTKIMEFFVGIGLLVAILVWMMFWWLRGLEPVAKFFPWFHYITLIVEFVLHFFGLVYAIINTVKLVLALFKPPFSFWELVNDHVEIFVLFLYVRILWNLAPVPYVLLKGSKDEKYEQGREIRSIQPLQDDAPVAQNV